MLELLCLNMAGAYLVGFLAALYSYYSFCTREGLPEGMTNVPEETVNSIGHDGLRMSYERMFGGETKIGR